jgi:copper(I)-binding protein
MKFLFSSIRTLSLMCVIWCMPCAAGAQSVEVKDAWVRGTVPTQKVTGAFMEITGKNAVRLLSADSPVAASVEIHNMTTQNGVMKMFPVDGIDIAAGKTVKLASGGYHVMLMGLKQQMKPGDRVPLKLTFELADKKRETLALSVEVRDIAGSRTSAH